MFLIGCGSSLDALRAEPEGLLAAPGSTLVSDEGISREFPMTGNESPNQAWRWYSSDASSDAIFTFFRERLLEKGWLSNTDDERLSKGWHTDDRTLVVQILAPPLGHGVEVEPGLTYYEVRIYGGRVK
jgi:hypothetical protein